jgi:hypothetical protein
VKVPAGISSARSARTHSWADRQAALSPVACRPRCVSRG